MNPDDVKCSNCLWWARKKSYHYHGLCKRYPPSRRILFSFEYKSPITHETDVCGEFRPREEAK